MQISWLPIIPFTASQAAELGVPRGRLRRLVEDGGVRRVLHGVYLRGDVVLTTHLKVAAASLVIGPTAVACDRTAAWLWDVDVFGHRELDVVPPIEVFALRGHTRTRRTEALGGVRDLADADWIQLDGVKVTTPLRTALDLGCCLHRREALAAMDALARGHAFSTAELARELPRYRRRRGVVQLRGLVPLVRPEAESMRETWTRLAMRDFGLPEPAVQYWVVLDGVPTYRLDLAYPHARIAIEYDGRLHHTSRADRARDEQRRAWLRAHGWTVIVVRAADLAPGADDGWLYAVRDALAQAHRRPRRIYS